MKEEYCKDCFNFYVYLSTLALPGKQFTPTCTRISGKFKPISEIKKCTKKKLTIEPEYFGGPISI